MATAPLITFKAGRCDLNGRKVTPVATPGYLYLYEEDDMLHLCWRPRTAPTTSPELSLLMIPGDGTFHPLVKEEGSEEVQSPTTGRIFVLKFSSSGQRYYFWMQSKTQSRTGDPSWFSPRDQRIGHIIDTLLQGEEVDVAGEIEELRRGADDDDDEDVDDDDEDGDAMDTDDAPAGGAHRNASGAASRGQGPNGGRAANSSSTSAPQDTNTLVQNFLNSLQGGNNSSTSNTPTNLPRQEADKPYTTLPDLLPPSITAAYISRASAAQIDSLCSYLPPDLFLLAQESQSSYSATQPSPAAAQAAIEALALEQKKDIISRVLHSPQLQQSLASLTVALRDGGLPMIGEALGLKVENGGHIKGGIMPLGGGAAVEAFVEGVKRTVTEDDSGN